MIVRKEKRIGEKRKWKKKEMKGKRYHQDSKQIGDLLGVSRSDGMDDNIRKETDFELGLRKKKRK